MVKLFKFFVLTICVFSCKTPNLVSPKNKVDNSLKLRGYYFRKYEDKIANINFTNVVFLYNNGIMLNCMNVKSHEIQKIEDYIRNEYLNSKLNIKDDILNWGIVNISNNEILIEQWFPSSGGPFPVRIKRGKVLNDTTFVLNSIEKQSGKDKKEISETYQFKRFSPKPDSTNNFIK